MNEIYYIGSENGIERKIIEKENTVNKDKVGTYKIVYEVTDKYGKTTTKDLISFILRSKYNVLYNLDSKNNVIGITNTLFKLNKR